MVNIARLIGPSLAACDRGHQRGLVFLVDGISYLAVIASLLAMRLRHNRPARGHFNGSRTG